MPAVIFAAPILSDNAARMIAATAALEDVRLGVISQAPAEDLPAGIRGRLAAHWRVDDVLDVAQLGSAVDALTGRLGRQKTVDCLFGAFEHLQVPLAEVRERLGIEGMGVETAKNFRDKARMKSLLRGAGIPCARHVLAVNGEQALEFAAQTGFPLVVKPPSGAGAQATHRVEDEAALRAALASASWPVLVEEFVTGDEHSLETVSIGGRPVWHSLTHYYPTPLEVLRNPWMQWCVVLPREADEPRYDDIKDAATRALEVLGMKTGLTHLEWFRRTDGSVAISEVAARPPGAQITTLVSRAHDFDFVAAWTRLMVYGTFEAPPRRYAVGAAYLRGQGEGRVRAIHGLDVVQREVGGLVVDCKLPQPGQDKAVSYEGEGYIILRHPDTKVVEQALHRLISVVRVELG